MEPPTLAHKLGTMVHLSPLLWKATRLGLRTARDLETLAVQRGCRHYQRGDEPPGELVSQDTFSNEELAIALLSLGLPYDPHTIRCGAAMLGAARNRPKDLAWLAITERCEPVVRHVTEAGRHFEPENPFWSKLLDLLPPTRPPKPGVLPHPTRFVAMTGLLRERGPGLYTQWQRPNPLPFAG